MEPKRFSPRRLELHLSTEDYESDAERINRDVRNTWTQEAKGGRVAVPPRSDVRITVFRLSEDGDRDSEVGAEPSAGPAPLSQSVQTAPPMQSDRFPPSGAARRRLSQAQDEERPHDASDASMEDDESFQEIESDDEPLIPTRPSVGRPHTTSMRSQPRKASANRAGRAGRTGRVGSSSSGSMSSRSGSRSISRSTSQSTSQSKRFLGAEERSASKTAKLGTRRRAM